MKDWINNEIKQIKSYQGSVIQKVMVFEMAIIETDDGCHLFDHPDCPFIQALSLYVWCENIGIVKFTTYQNDCDSGIYSSTLTDMDELIYEPETPSIYRMRPCHAFPLGKLESIEVSQNEYGDIAEIILRIEKHDVLLKSGEVEQRHDGSIIVRDNDESVLVFMNPDDIDRVTFNA